MARPVMQLEGTQALRAAFAQSPDLLRHHIAPRLHRSTFSATNRAQVAAPEKTGHLRRSIYGSVSPLSGRVLIDDSAYYWRMIEFGTIYQNARPFIRTTAELETPDFERGMEEAAQGFARDFSASRFV